MSAQALEQPVAYGDRYWLTELLAVGGMAEIYLAQQSAAAVDDWAKQVVIKRLKPSLASDVRIATLFADEGNLGALLHHPNVVQVFDVGATQGDSFIAMEYIAGEELTEVCRRGLSAGMFLPLPLAVEVVRQAALALGYIHALRDDRGRPLSVVHCDISPTNLLVTPDGFVKLIDFGISRYRGQQYRDEHAVPGKLSYMSPEQARRSRVDARSDVYSLGIVLYELTLGRRLYKGTADDVFGRLTTGQVQPPTFVRNDYPGALESVVMRALESDPAERFDNAYEFADALAAYLRDEKLASGPLALARYLDSLSVQAGAPRREELIPEHESAGDDDALDFDRGLFSGYRAVHEPDPVAASEWEDEQDEHAVAAALGIDVELVRVAGKRPADSPPRSHTARPAKPEAAPPTAAVDAAADAAPVAPPRPYEPLMSDRTIGSRGGGAGPFIIGLLIGLVAAGLVWLLIK